MRLTCTQGEMTQTDEDIKVLKEFLSFDIQSADEVFAKFNQLDGVKIYQSGKYGERFLFKQGSRIDRLTLIAHADTFYCKKRKQLEQIEQGIVQTDNILHGKNPDYGIGADDRAGCAILWLMRDSGHNILLLDGEEKFYRGARYLMNEHKVIFEEIQKSRFAVEFDFPHADELSYHDTLAHDAFRKYIEEKTGYKDNPRTPPTDIGVLCQNMCAVNLSVGYFDHHTKDEYLDIIAWFKTLNVIRKISQEQIPKFEI